MVSQSKLGRIAALSLLARRLAPAAGEGGWLVHSLRSGAWLIALLLVAWVVSEWFWAFMAPPPLERKVDLVQYGDHQAAARAIAARHLFGVAKRDGSGDADRPAASRIRLLGGMTASRNAAGFAILMEEGKPPLAVIEGEAPFPGVTLVEVLPGRARLQIEGRSEMIEMDEAAGPALRQGVGGPTPMQSERERVPADAKNMNHGRPPPRQ